MQKKTQRPGILEAPTILWIFYIIAAAALFFFSYTQVDLGLTLSHASLWRTIQTLFQHVGFYQRSVATTWYVGLVCIFFVLYFIAIRRVLEKKITFAQVNKIAISVMAILLFSYSAAFSYDIYNYIFTAKTLTVYEKNPYTVIPLQFAGIDSMLSFMRWTHLPSAYTPLWITMTIPEYLLSFQSLLVSLWLMKVIPIGFYVLSIWAIRRILEREDRERADLGATIFALNPLVFIEVGVSGHNDVVMMGFALLSYLFYMEKRRLTSFFMLALSVATKLMTATLLPLQVIGWRRGRAIGLLTLGLLAVLLKREFLAWYLLWLLPFAALLPQKRIMYIILFGGSFGLLLKYAPVFYFGTYDPPVPQLQLFLLWGGIVLGSIAGLFIPGGIPQWLSFARKRENRV